MAMVLLVDDDADNREMYALFLTKRGFEVMEAHDGKSALAVAHEHRPSLIVMDLTLPDIDGVQVIHRLHADPRTRSTPVIVVSGYSLDPSDLDGPAPWRAFLMKPCAPDTLVQKINELVRDADGGAV